MLRTAVIGVGYLGKFHAEKLAKSPNAELVAVVDTDLAQAKKVGKRNKASHVLSDYKELPALGINCANVASNTSTHFEVSKFLLENGIDVLVEKPMTCTTEEARTLINIATQNKRIIQVGHLERFNAAFQAMKEVLTRPRFFEVRRIAKFKGRGCDVDVVADLMIHDIDIVAHLVGRPAIRVEAVGVPVLTRTIDIANARITFEGGAVANFSASRAAFTSERSIRVFQPNVYISLDYEKKKLKIYTRTPGTDKDGFAGISTYERKVQERDALEDEIESFLEAVKYRSAPEVSGYDGLRALELADMIRVAFKESQAILEADEESNDIGQYVNF